MKIKKKVQEKEINTKIFKGTDGRYHYLYQITNLINGKYYVGMHSADQLDDDYDGSGWALKKAYEKYGKDKFEKEILEFCYSRKEVLELEASIVDQDFVDDSMTYNLVTGGQSPLYVSRETRNKMSNTWKERYKKMPHPFLGKFHSDEAKQRMSNARKGKRKGDKHPLYGKHHSDESREKMSKSRKGKVKSAEHRKHLSESHTGKVLKESTKEKLREINIGTKLVHRFVNGIIEKKKIEPEELNEYLNSGWLLGIGVKKNKVHRFVDGKKESIWILENELEKYLSEGWIRGRGTGFKAINKKGTVKVVLISEVDKYIEKGWKLGRGVKRFCISKEGKIKRVLFSELKSYLDDGWKRVINKKKINKIVE